MFKHTGQKAILPLAKRGLLYSTDEYLSFLGHTHTHSLSPMNQASSLNGALIGSQSHPLTLTRLHCVHLYSTCYDDSRMNTGYQVDVFRPPLNPSNSDKLKRQNDHLVESFFHINAGFSLQKVPSFFMSPLKRF